MRPSLHSQWSFRVQSKGSVDEDVSVQRLRTTLTNSLVNMGLLSAFMCALANGIYANPPGDPMCRGESAVRTMTIIEWVSMGCFFLTIILTVILASDMDGVPDDLLVRHLRTNLRLYTAPQAFAYVGLMLLACGYGVDLDERIGCPTFRFGALAAPFFPLLTFAVMKYAQSRRRRTGASGENGDENGAAPTPALGLALFATWNDLLVSSPGGGEEAGADAADARGEGVDAR
jgi:hypothetical protein